MKGFTAFTNKEFMDQIRSGRLLAFGATFIILGIFSPLMAKLTPMLYESYSETLAEQGIIIGEITVTAADSWGQFIKNVPLAVLITVIIFSGIFSNEYTKGTLIPLFTKGLERHVAVLSKYFVMFVMWAVGIWVIFGITYVYTAFYWDNSIMNNLIFVCIGWWIFGIFMISALTAVSAFATSMVQVLLGTGAIYIVLFIMSQFSEISGYLPVRLTKSAGLLAGTEAPNDFTAALIITVTASIVLLGIAMAATDRRQL